VTSYGPVKPEPPPADQARRDERVWRRLNEFSEDLDLLEHRCYRLERHLSRLAWAGLAFILAFALTGLYFTGGGR
jgi:hypothetical protein